MKVTDTNLKGCVVIEPTRYYDDRGYFFESFNEAVFQKEIDTPTRFVQDNQSFSTYGVLRGLHGQIGDYAQAKLVRVLEGEVLDVALDARCDSPTYGQHFAIKLSAESGLQLFIPRGFLHGFVVLSKTAQFFYKCDNVYNKDAEIGIIYNDLDIGVNWILPKEDLVISEKDLLLPTFQNIYEESVYTRR
jgi:dTDP-4-dehydrorhamnose 3,5-epimerase